MRIFDWGKTRREFNLVALDPTGQTLAAGGHYQPTVVWDALGGAERTRFDAYAYALQFHPLDGRLFFSTRDGLRTYDPKTGAVTVVTAGEQYAAPALAFAPNKDWAVYLLRSEDRPSTLAALTRFGHPDQTILWNTGFSTSPNESGHAWYLACLPGGERFLSVERIYGSNPGQLDGFAIRSRTDGRVLQTSPNRIFTSEIRVFGSPWNDAAIILDRKQFWVHDCNDLAAPPHAIRNDKRRNFTGAAFHPSGRYLGVTSNDKTVKLFDTTTWEAVRTFTWDIGKMRSVCFSPDGTLAAAGSDTGKVVVWDVDL